MAELIRREFAAYAGSNNTKIDGLEVVLSAEAGQAMGIVFHELVTNAAKYGALSTPVWPRLGTLVSQAERERAVGCHLAGNRRTKRRSTKEIWLWHRRSSPSYPIRIRRFG